MKLKNCPFCGCDVGEFQINPVSQTGIKTFGVYCLNKNCEATIEGFGVEDDVIKAWNRRK